MRRITRFVTGAAAAALVTTGFAAAPAQAQRYYDRDRGGIDVGDVVAGVAIIGGIAAIASAVSRDGNRNGYYNRYQYRDNYSDAVNTCGYQAQRYAQGGRVSVTDVDRRGNGYRVRGVVDGFNGYDRYNRYDARVAFSCDTDRYGRVRDFDVNRSNW